jgi:peptide/nickel transport system ATP-binding protein
VPQGKKRGQMLTQIAGMTPSLVNLPTGCKFHPRCSRADAACLVEPMLAEVLPGRAVRCFHPHVEAARKEMVS